MNFFILINILFLLNFAAAQFPIPEGKTCADYCQSSSVFDPNELFTGIFYMTETIPYFYDEDIRCGYFTFTEPDENKYHFIETLTQ
ncbi:CLUMA_CG018682, isoform A [Clunio marinus]|uniref:CLUMA_CG018682, isoform A n=1 Tax=Clunio marinus TaxID=568069 RepID=A0A1J1IZL1_9DIPT|nr:CLUMA_CG018682, isoform A [Clunio marinus]